LETHEAAEAVGDGRVRARHPETDTLFRADPGSRAESASRRATCWRDTGPAGPAAPAKPPTRQPDPPAVAAVRAHAGPSAGPARSGWLPSESARRLPQPGPAGAGDATAQCRDAGGNPGARSEYRHACRRGATCGHRMYPRACAGAASPVTQERELPTRSGRGQVQDVAPRA